MVTTIYDIMSTKQGQERFIGFQSAMKNFQLPIHPKWLLSGEATESDGYPTIKDEDEFKKL